MTVTERKAAARRRAFALRKAAHAAHRQAASTALAEHLTGTVDAVVAGYLPIRTEADPLPAMEMLAARNRVAVPVIAGAGKPLIFREWHPGCPLDEGPFGVMVPREGDTLVPTLLIVPLVAFDNNFYRLGYGGGFYDRTLQKLRSRGPVVAIGLAYAAQCFDDLPQEPTDQPLDAVVTEAGALPLAP